MPETGVMVAFMVPEETKQKLPFSDGLREVAHITLAYLGQVDEVGPVDDLRDILAQWALGQQPIEGRVGGTGRFYDTEGPADTAFYTSYDAGELSAFRQDLADMLEKAGYPPKKNHGFTPHITLAYLSSQDPDPDIRFEPFPLDFDAVTLCYGEKQYEFPLGANAMNKMIRKEGNEIILYSSDGDKVLGRFPFGEGQTYASEETAREAAAERERQVQYFSQAERAIWVTQEQMQQLCPGCAEQMAAKNWSRVNLAGLKQMPPELLSGLCDRMGESFDTCMGMDFGEFSPSDKPSFCAWLHHECTGKWPGEKSSPGEKTAPGEKSVDLEDLAIQIRAAWYDQFYKGETDQRWVREVYDDKVIVEGPEGLHAYPYQIDDEGLVQWDVPVKVEKQYEETETPAQRSVDALTDTAPDTPPDDTPGNIPDTSPVDVPSLQDAIKAQNIVTFQGGELKALDDGWVGGYAVRFSPGGEPRDLVDEYFESDTDFVWPGLERRPAMYHHGMDNTLGAKFLGLGGQGWTLEKIDNVGVWVKQQLDMRDEYEREIYKMARDKKMGLSSGTAEHLILRTANGKITRWPIMEISYTPTPAEPRTAVTPIRAMLDFIPFKSLLDLDPEQQPVEAEPNPSGPDGDIQDERRVDIKIRFGGTTMDLNELFGSVQSLLGLDEEQSAKVKAALQLLSRRKSIKMADIEALMAHIQSLVPGLSDEQYAQLQHILMLATGEEEAPAPADEYYDEGMMGMDTEEEPTRSRRTRAPTRSRPPYPFFTTPSSRQDTPEQSVDAAMRSLRGFREMSPAVRTIAHDLYGPEYQDKVLAQKRAYVRYLRGGPMELESGDRKLLKTIILMPGQIETFVKSGLSIRELKTDMSSVIADLGGFLVPEDYRLDMIRRLPGITIVRARAETYTTSSDMMTRVKVTGGGDQNPSNISITWVGDVAADGDADTNETYGVERTPVHIAKATIHVPMALLEDTPFNLVENINQDVSVAYAQDEDNQFLVGNGIAKPEGILADQGISALGTSQQVVSGNATALTADGLIDLQYGLAQQYWDSAIFIMNRSTAAIIRKFKGGDGHYLWAENVVAGLTTGQQPTLLGFPVQMSEYMPDVAANAFPVLFVNLYELYQIADRIGMSVIRDEYTEADQDLIRFIYRRRVGGQVKQNKAGVAQKVST